MIRIFNILIFIMLVGCQVKSSDGGSVVNGPAVQGPSAISILAPLNATYGEGSSLDFQITFDASVNVVGTPCLILTIGSSAKQACLVSGSGTPTLSFTYTVAALDSDINGIALNTNIALNGATIKGPALNNAVANLAAIMPNLSSIFVDTSITPPDQVSVVNQTNLNEARTEVSLSWPAPNDNGNAITEYSVRYKLSSASVYTYLNPNPAVTNTSISALVAESSYDIQVAAFNGVMGAYSPVLKISTVFTPASLGALIWYEAKDINGDGSPVADGTSINTLVDKSGSSNNADILSGAPATIETVDGKKVLRLTSSGYRTIASLGETNNIEIEVYIVAKTRVVSNSFAFVNENEANNNRFGSHFPWGNSNAYVDLPMGNRFSGNWSGNTSDFLAWTFRGTTTQGAALEKNGVQILSNGNRTLTPPLKKWTIGSNYAGSTSYWQADLVTIFVFDKMLSTTQRDDFYQYLETEYGVDMP